MKQLNGYLCFYRGKRAEVYAETSLQAQEQAMIIFKVKKRYDITAMLVEKDGKPYEQTATF